MAKTKVLITVTAYPLPSRSYDELVCTAGVREDGSWVRIYPVPFKFLEFKKYQWVELDLQEPRQKDFRPESHSPVKPDLSDMVVVGELGTKYNWEDRKKFCLKQVYTNMTTLIEDSKEPANKSLATFKPTDIIDLIIEPDEKVWKKDWLDQLSQLDLFTSGKGQKPREPIRKVPYKFKYHFKDETGRESKMMIEDWEIGALYWNCLRDAEGNENVAIRKVKQKYFNDLALTKDVYLFLGTTAEGHRRRWSNPFVIIGVFYPPKVVQTRLNL